jgi:tetratricopeptide (TPR) repeat protein
MQNFWGTPQAAVRVRIYRWNRAMTNFRFAKQILVLACLLACQQFAVAADELLLRAKKLVDEKKAAQAYALLAPLQSERAGEPDYDYLLALAALDSGKPAEAVFALERFLAINPNHGPARLELARAYYMMGETKASRQEFESVKSQAPPDQVNAAIQKYLSVIEQISTEEGTKYRGYVEMSGGRDSNANSATSATQIALPAFGGAIGVLDPSSTRRSDNFLGAAAGISMRHALSAAWAVNAHANINQRKYSRYSQYDLGSIDSTVGVTNTRGIDQFTGALQYQKLYLDRTGFRQTVGLLGQWQHSIDDLSQFTTYGQLMGLNYQAGQEIRNANRYLVGAAYSRAFPGALSPIVYAGAYLGSERPRNSAVPHLGNNFAGLRIGGQLSVAPTTVLVASASHEFRDYRGEEPGFLRDRSDRQTDLSLSLVYAPALHWTVKPEISYTRNSSNIILNDFSRTQYFVTVRREFD